VDLPPLSYRQGSLPCCEVINQHNRNYTNNVCWRHDYYHVFTDIEHNRLITWEGKCICVMENICIKMYQFSYYAILPLFLQLTFFQTQFHWILQIWHSLHMFVTNVTHSVHLFQLGDWLPLKFLNTDEELTFFLSFSWTLSGAVEGLNGRLDKGLVGELFLLFSFSFSSLEIDLEEQIYFIPISLHNFYNYACFIVCCCVYQMWQNMLPHNTRITVIMHLKKVKGKVVPLHYTEAPLGERRYSSYSFLTSALEGAEWSA
jgi:hypothetical protein